MPGRLARTSVEQLHLLFVEPVGLLERALDAHKVLLSHATFADTCEELAATLRHFVEVCRVDNLSDGSVAGQGLRRQQKHIELA